MSFIIAAAVVAVVLAVGLPVVITVLYKRAYNKHANNQLNHMSKDTKSWLPPFAVLLISYGVSFTVLFPILYFILFVWLILGDGTSFNSADTYTYEQAVYTDYYVVDYTGFDGTPRYGYSLEEYDKGDFHYYLYTKNARNTDYNDSDYMLMIEYKGDKEIKSFVQTALFVENGNIDYFVDWGYSSDRYYAKINTAFSPSDRTDTEEAVHTRVIYKLEMLGKDIQNPNSADYEQYCEDTFVLEITE